MFLIIKKIYRFYKFYDGPYLNWSEAKKNSHGYGHHKIIKRILNTAIKAKEVKKFEKDGFLLDKLDNDKTIIRLSNKSRNELNIIDFGGGFGTLHSQYKKFLNKKYNWYIIEQKKYVKLSHKFFKEKNVFFFSNLKSNKIQKSKINFVIFSSSIQYLKNYEETIKQVLNLNPEYLIFLKTPLNYKNKNQIFIQNIPQNVYEGSYPSWVFSKQYFFDIFRKKFKIFKAYTVNPKLYFVDHYNIYMKLKK